MNIIMSTLVVLGLLFGGSAIVSAAQDDLPTEPLYQIKLMSEDVSVWLASDPIAKIDRLMELAQTRTEEMAALVSAGVIPPVELTTRTQERIHQALQLTATLDDPALLATLEKIQTCMQAQGQLMAQLQDGSCAECEPILQQTRDMLQTQFHQVEGGLSDPGSFRNQNQNQNQNQVRTAQTPLATYTIATLLGCCTPALDGTGQ